MTDKPTIEFPCAYPIKVVGEAGDDFHAFVLAVVERHAAFDREAVRSRDSRNGNWVSITLTITATGTEQLQALHQDLRADARVQMVL